MLILTSRIAENNHKSSRPKRAINFKDVIPKKTQLRLLSAEGGKSFSCCARKENDFFELLKSKGEALLKRRFAPLDEFNPPSLKTCYWSVCFFSMLRYTSRNNLQPSGTPTRITT
eukprot:TRINITY_DN4988_c0_g2_i12.p5 TRINITY_DN4988_c0_g2~~TRINITY_DN4988_c0_g2_i12.p5  ORF type:complete len:115 (+),score=6.77 TRINITY_DN4988_c0_g2_i12:565-909(+)